MFIKKHSSRYLILLRTPESLLYILASVAYPTLSEFDILQSSLCCDVSARHPSNYTYPFPQTWTFVKIETVLLKYH